MSLLTWLKTITKKKENFTESMKEMKTVEEKHLNGLTLSQKRHLTQSKEFLSLSDEQQKEIRRFLWGSLDKITKRHLLADGSFIVPNKITPNDLLELIKKSKIKKDKVQKQHKPRNYNRLVRIAELRSEGKSLEYIGNILGISRERVRQIERMAGLPPRGYMFAHVPKPKIKKVCLKCGSEFTPRTKTQKYCSSSCFMGRNGTKEERIELAKQKNRARAKAYYAANKDNPEFRHKTYERNNLYYKKMKEKKKQKLEQIKNKLRDMGLYDVDKMLDF